MADCQHTSTVAAKVTEAVKKLDLPTYNPRAPLALLGAWPQRQPCFKTRNRSSYAGAPGQSGIFALSAGARLASGPSRVSRPQEAQDNTPPSEAPNPDILLSSELIKDFRFVIEAASLTVVAFYRPATKVKVAKTVPLPL